jgi:hypothetical protein
LLFFKSQLQDPTLPNALADVIVHAVETDEPRLRYVVGADTRICVDGRAGLSDEQWARWQAEPNDEAFEASALEIFGLDMYHPPFANSLARSGGAK